MLLANTGAYPQIALHFTCFVLRLQHIPLLPADTGFAVLAYNICQ